MSPEDVSVFDDYRRVLGPMYRRECGVGKHVRVHFFADREKGRLAMCGKHPYETSRLMMEDAAACRGCVTEAQRRVAAERNR